MVSYITRYLYKLTDYLQNIMIGHKLEFENNAREYLHERLDGSIKNYYIDSIRRHKYVEVLVNATCILGTPDGCRLPQQASVGRSCICYMSNVRVKQHPTLGILVCTDGHVMIPKRYNRKAHWTFGSNGTDGYKVVKIKYKHYYVHRLIAETFLDNPQNKPEIDHINRNPSDNRLENLRWATRSENNRNTSANDPANLKYGVHTYDTADYYKIKAKGYRATDKGKQSRKRYEHKRSASCKFVKFKDGTAQWIPNAEAIKYRGIPVAQREVPQYIKDLRNKRR